MISRGPEWHRWASHIHAPGPIINDQFGTADPWRDLVRIHFAEYNCAGLMRFHTVLAVE